MSGKGKPVTEAERRAVERMPPGTPKKEIARATHLSPATISRILKK